MAGNQSPSGGSIYETQTPFSGDHVAPNAVSGALSRGRHGGRPYVDLTAYKDDLIQMYQSGMPNKDIVKWLKEEKQVKVEIRSLTRRFGEWEVPKKRIWMADTVDVDKLKEALYPLVLQKLDDDKILGQLIEQGFKVSIWHVRRLRKDMGLRRRHDPNVSCEVCKNQGRYPKEGCPHQSQHQSTPQRKPAEVSKSLREEVKALKKQMRDMQSETKKKEKEQEQLQEKLQKENETLKEQLKNAAWPQQQPFIDPALSNPSQYGQYPEPSRWNS